MFILLPLLAKSPPSCGDVSYTIPAPTAATSTPSTVPVTVIFPVTSIPAPKSVLPAIVVVPSEAIVNLFVVFV